MLSKILKSKAVKKPLTANPVTKFPANKIITALITNKNKPKLTMVAGKVKKINNGLTNIFNKEMTTATQIAVTELSIWIPGNNIDNKTTAMAVRSIFKIKFIFIILRILILQRKQYQFYFLAK